LVLEHVEKLEPIFSQVTRVLRSGGMAYLSELHPEVGLPVDHLDVATTLRAKLGAVEEHYDNLIECVNLIRIQVVFAVVTSRSRTRPALQFIP
jgi:hypothetical protein